MFSGTKTLLGEGRSVAPVQGCAMLREDQIKLVMGPDNRPTGEAFVEIAGPGANLALALAKDRQVMPVRKRSLPFCCGHVHLEYCC